MKLAAAAHPIAEILWRAAFRASRVLANPRISLCPPAGNRRVLVIAAHPDDEAVGCAGTMLLHARSGDTVSVAYITDGSGSRAGGLNAEQMRQQREKEAQAAASLLQVKHCAWLGLREGEWTHEEMRYHLLPLLRQTVPHYIYAPSRIDFHPEHHKVAHGLARLLSEARQDLSTTILRICQLQVPLTPILTNLVMDCSAVSAQAAAVLQAYVSQASNLGRAVRMHRYSALRHGFRTHGEEFWQMPAAAYTRIHSNPPKEWDAPRFRGIRFRPFSDPLAYLAGLEARRCLRHAAESDDKMSEGS